MLGGYPVVVDDVEEAVKKTVDLLIKYACRMVYVCDMPFEWKKPLVNELRREAFDVCESADRKAVEFLKKADAGVSEAKFAVALTGTVVEVAYDDIQRMVSAYPRVHILFLKKSSIIPTLNSLATPLREIMLKGRAAVSLISGPSRSGDIEQTLTIGIHGPNVVAAVIIK